MIKMAADQPQCVSFTFLNFPQSILLGNQRYPLSFEIINLLVSREEYEIKAKAEQAQVFLDSQISKTIALNTKEKQNFVIELLPTSNGAARLTIEVIHLKKEEFEEVFWEVKKKIEKAVIKAILKENPIQPFDLDFQLSQIPNKISLNGRSPLSAKDAMEIVAEIQSPPKLPPLRKIVRQVERQIPIKTEEKEPPIQDDGLTSQDDALLAQEDISITQEPEIKTETIIETVVEYVQDPAPPELSIDQKDVQYADLVRRVAGQAIECAFDIAKLISKEETRKELYQLILPLGYSQNFKGVLKEVLSLPFPDLKNQILTEMAYFRIKIDPSESAMVLLNIPDADLRDEILSHIILHESRVHPELASNLIYQLSSQELQNKILFDLIKYWREENKDLAISSLKSLIENIMTESNADLIRTCMILLANLTTPQSVIELINNIQREEDRIWLKHLLKTDLKVQKKRKKIRIVPQVVHTSFYVFPSAAGEISPALAHLAQIGGNISINLLESSQKPNIIFLCPYEYQFSLFSSMQQSYFPLESELNKTFGYLIYPEKNSFDDEGWNHLKNLLDTYIFHNNKINQNETAPIHIILLDFIPYLSKPSIFYSSYGKNQDLAIFSKINLLTRFGINTMKNEQFFHEGDILDQIQSVIPNSKRFKLLNVVLTYNFLRDLPFLNLFFKIIVQ